MSDMPAVRACPPVPPPARPILLIATHSPDDAARLQAAFEPVASCECVPLERARLQQRIEATQARAVLIDFGGESRNQAAALGHALRLQAGVRVAAVGRASHAPDAIAALRAGVQEFMDVEGPPEELRRLLSGLLEGGHSAGAQKGMAVALLGARGGLGTSTLAANLAELLQRHGPGRRTLLLDMGLPVADSALLFGLESGFHFAEAARSLDRLDRTLVDTAMPRSPQGVALLPLPPQLQELREIPHATAASVIARLRELFDAVVLDLGGFSNSDFVTRVAAQCEHCLVVCDQAATSVHSTARLASELAERGIAARLLVNRADPALAPSPAQLGQHLRLPLAGSLPARYAAHVQALNEGRLLVQAAPADPYSRAVQTLAWQLLGCARPAAASGTGWLARWRQRGDAA